MLKSIRSVVVILIFLTFPLLAQEDLTSSDEKKSVDEKADSSSVAEKKQQKERWGITAFPAISASKETSFTFGVIGILYHYPYKIGDEKLKDDLTLLGVYTLKNQWTLRLEGNKYLDRGAYKVYSYTAFNIWPDFYWGVGPDTSDSQKERYEAKEIWWRAAFMFKLHDGLYLGPLYRLLWYDLFMTDMGMELEKDPKAFVSGIGAELHWDTRDNKYFPKNGFFLIARTVYYHNYLGSQHNFGYYLADYRHFLEIYKNQILAFRARYEGVAGDAPTLMIPRSGGNSSMRGLYYGRFRDKQYYSFETEYRFPIYWRFGGVVFGNVGDVQERPDHFKFRTLKYALGIGLRFKLDKEQHINVRIDFTFLQEKDPMPYMYMLEAY